VTGLSDPAADGDPHAPADAGRLAGPDALGVA
jgi:hypothetical protein